MIEVHIFRDFIWEASGPTSFTEPFYTTDSRTSDCWTRGLIGFSNVEVRGLGRAASIVLAKNQKKGASAENYNMDFLGGS
jgi:hypothetical protein